MSDDTPTSALIYCRVSSKKQTAEGSGLESQEHRCRQYAEAKGYEVVAVFPDDVSGGGDFMKRPGMVALLSFLDAQPDKRYVIIFDDLKRLARDTIFHLKLRQELTKRDAIPECLNFNFDDTPEGKFFETMFAAQGELERHQIRRQTAQKMRARIENGYWVFRTLPGYRYKQRRGEGKVLIRDEPVASIMQEALEGYASGYFASQAEVQRFLQSQPDFPKQASGNIRLQKVTDLLTHPLYAGYVQAIKWDIAKRKGRHEPLISRTTFEKIQQRIKDGAMTPRRSNLGQEFALRGFVACDCCGVPLRSCFSKSGSGKRYGYYLCQTKGCDAYGKSIPRKKLEGEFETFLKALRPSVPLYKAICAMFWDAWEQRSAQTGETRKALQNALNKTERQIDRYVDRIGEASSQAAITAYERKIDTLERDRLITEEKLQAIGHKSGVNSKAARKKLELALKFFANPWKLWESGDQTLRNLVLRLTFTDRISYCRKSGTRTPQVTVPFTLFGISEGSCNMVPGGGIEPPTRGFSIIVDSIQTPD